MNAGMMALQPSLERNCYLRARKACVANILIDTSGESFVFMIIIL